MDRDSRWMAVSGSAGFVFFLIANFTNFFVGSSQLAGYVQLCINAFVSVVWTKAFFRSHGLKKFVAFFGIVVPVVMASITILRVLIPIAVR